VRKMVLFPVMPVEANFTKKQTMLNQLIAYIISAPQAKLLDRNLLLIHSKWFVSYFRVADMLLSI
jgi:hypothetical protein